MTEYGYPKNDYAFYLSEARGMSNETIREQLYWIRHLSDDPGECIATEGMQNMFAAYTHVLEERGETIKLLSQ